MAAKEVISLSLGGGWQSTALALLLDRGELEGYPRPDVAVFADTKAEPPWVYQTLDALEGILSYPLVRTSYGNLEEDTWRSIRGEPTRRHPNQLPEEDGKPARGFIDIPAYLLPTGAVQEALHPGLQDPGRQASHSRNVRLAHQVDPVHGDQRG